MHYLVGGPMDGHEFRSPPGVPEIPSAGDVIEFPAFLTPWEAHSVGRLRVYRSLSPEPSRPLEVVRYRCVSGSQWTYVIHELPAAAGEGESC